MLAARGCALRFGAAARNRIRPGRERLGNPASPTRKNSRREEAQRPLETVVIQLNPRLVSVWFVTSQNESTTVNMTLPTRSTQACFWHRTATNPEQALVEAGEYELRGRPLRDARHRP